MDPTRIAFERQGSGRPLVLLHGLGDRRRSWSAVLPHLVREHCVLCIDLPGFGRTPAPSADEPYDVASMTDAVEAFCRFHGLERPHIAGNSLGGAIALELGVRGVAGSVTVFSPAGFSGGPGRWGLYAAGAFARAAARVPMPVKEKLAGTRPARSLARTLLRGAPSASRSETVHFSVRGLQEGSPFIRMIPRIAEYDFAARPIDCPVTIAWGDRDRTLPPSGAGRAHRRVPTACMVSLIGSGHIPMADDPVTVARHIERTCRSADLRRGGNGRPTRAASL